MRDYEVVYIFHPMLDEDAVNGVLDRLHPHATAADGADVTAVDHWGVRQLAYRVREQSQGYYVVAQFTAEPSDIAEFERLLKLEDDLLRYLVVLSEGEPSGGMSILAETEASEETDEDEDGEDDDEDEEDGEDGEDGDTPPEFSGGRGKRRRVEGPRVELLNYKDVRTLSRFVTEQGKILPKRTTKVTARFQRQLGTAVKRARYLALLPYIQKHDG